MKLLGMIIHTLWYDQRGYPLRCYSGIQKFSFLSCWRFLRGGANYIILEKYEE